MFFWKKKSKNGNQGSRSTSRSYPKTLILRSERWRQPGQFLPWEILILTRLSYEDFMGKVYCGVVLINLLSLKKELNLFNKGPRQRGEDKLWWCYCSGQASEKERERERIKGQGGRDSLFLHRLLSSDHLAILRSPSKSTCSCQLSSLRSRILKSTLAPLASTPSACRKCSPCSTWRPPMVSLSASPRSRLLSLSPKSIVSHPSWPALPYLKVLFGPLGISDFCLLSCWRMADHDRRRKAVKKLRPRARSHADPEPTFRRDDEITAVERILRGEVDGDLADLFRDLTRTHSGSSFTAKAA